MTILTFTLLLLFFSFIAGFLGALTGLGGGIIIIPVLILIFHINIHLAMGASIISVIATSSGTAAAYLRQGYSNLRIGIFLESAAVSGALIGAILIPFFSKSILGIIFSLVLFVSAYLTLKRSHLSNTVQSAHPWANVLKLNGSYPDSTGHLKPYYVQHVPLAFIIMSIAGVLSGLLGIGSGALKVLAMDQALSLPYKVSTTTSNFMIGITAAVSAGIYFSHGYINPIIAFPVMIGVISGAFIGAKVISHIKTHNLRIIFSIAICFIGLQMLYKAVMGTI